MEIEQIGNVTQYRFNWIEHTVANAVLKHIDRQRRSGVFDSLPIHSATRAIFSDGEPENDEHGLVRWILDDNESIGEINKQAEPAPSPELLGQLMEHARSAIDSGDRTACIKSIGKITLSKQGYSSSTANFQQPLAALSGQIDSFAYIIQNKEK